MRLQVLVTGKISQAVVVAAAAYRSEAAFIERTGIKKTKLIIDDSHTNTHVSSIIMQCMISVYDRSYDMWQTVKAYAACSKPSQTLAAKCHPV